MQSQKPALPSGSCPFRPEAQLELSRALGPGCQAGLCWL